MGTENTNVVTLANSIIGVGILAMPFCFQKCGILLSIILLLISNLITRVSCHYLLKSSILTRRKNIEFLAFQAFGSSGKLIVELCIIGYLFGTCVGYYVVMGDLGPQIISKMLTFAESDSLRFWVMVFMTVICVIPLGLLRNIDSLSAVCTISIGFYICFVLKIIGESKVQIKSGEWFDYVKWWEPAGVLQCLPIFSMALSCQMQLFEVSESMPGASLDRMNNTVKSATWICTISYILVGFFGYVAFCTVEFSGNILMNLTQSMSSDIIKIGFVLSVAFSFPLVIFPCRASLYSLLYRHGHVESTQFIPELKFRFITVAIVVAALIVGIYIPSIELVIGLVGSTIGVAICIIFPSMCFTKVSKKDSSEKSLAKFLIVFGFCLMVLGTYANLSAIDEKTSGTHTHRHLSEVVPKVPVQENLEMASEKSIKAVEENKEIIPEKIIPPKEEKKIGNFDKTKEKIAKINAKAKENATAQILEKVIDVVKQIEDKPPEIVEDPKKDLNKDAIKKEEEEIKQEEMDKKEIIKEEINAVVDEIKRHNEETQKLVLEKLEQIVEKIDLKETKAESSNNDSKKIPIKALPIPILYNISIPKNETLPEPESKLPVETKLNDNKENESLAKEAQPEEKAKEIESPNKEKEQPAEEVDNVKVPEKLPQEPVDVVKEEEPKEKDGGDTNRRDLLGVDRETRRKRNVENCEKQIS